MIALLRKFLHNREEEKMNLDFLTIPEIQLTDFDPVAFQYFNQLFNKRTIIFNTEVDENIIETVYLPLRDFELDPSNEPITLILNSPGGSVCDGLFLAHYLASYKKKLNIIVVGYAASLAAVILAAGGKNDNVHRICYPSTYALIHDGYVAIPPSESKTAGDIMIFNDHVDQQIRDFIITHTNITPELYDSKARHQWFITAPEMKELNLIDEIIGCD